MVKKSTIIFTILAMLAFGACTCWGYTVSQWPVPGIPNTVYGPSSACLGRSNNPNQISRIRRIRLPGNTAETTADNYGGYGRGYYGRDRHR